MCKLETSRVLIVDDASSVLHMMRRMLAPLVSETFTAENASQALEMVDSFSNQPFDVILMDVRMPGMNGMEAMKRLREMGCRTPVIALTAGDLDSNHDDYCSAGFSEIVFKPVDRSVLIDALQKTIKTDRI